MFGGSRKKKMANAIRALVDDTLTSSESKKTFIQSAISHNGIPSTSDTMEIWIRSEISERMRTIGIEADHGSENYGMVVVEVTLFGGETPDGEFFDTTNYQVSYVVRNVKRYCNE